MRKVTVDSLFAEENMTAYWNAFAKRVTRGALLIVALGVFALPAHSNPLAFWRGEGDNLDSVGSHHATPLVGVSFAPGQVGQAFSLDGSLSTGLAIAADPCLRLPHSCTFVAWINTTAAGTPWGPHSFADILRKRHRDHGGLMDITLGMMNGRARFVLTDDTEVTGAIQSAKMINDGQWHHVAAVRDADNSLMTLYVDGVLEASNSTAVTTFTETNGVPWLIGNSGGTAKFPWDGLIDEVAILNCALSDQEILDIANGNPIPGTESGPWITVTASGGGSLYIEFTGSLETSEDLVSTDWPAITPLVCSPYIFTPATNDTYRFFRARKP